MAFGFGSGLIPTAPGTAGSLCAVPIVWLMGQIEPIFLYGVICATSILFGIRICERAGQHLGKHDHPSIVWDEIVGMQITLILVPTTFINLMMGFFLFRFLDIVKPWPVSWFDKNIQGGVGVMLDDIVAGAIAAIVLYGISIL
ncbi:MAG: phosphatidylglycerophosphatase A [Gammaproteobacteria bacterium]|nr:phosphatidylglycerophosphatase A [Gammaproteobacteria bacterium]MCY4218538.1 phosphatidylglycerophosphatase A [Gammaproteobacteria bacterium]MCY4275009.1 phosphatidylglycerophosphatase A [Gammaproteobacteria bacterium]